MHLEAYQKYNYKSSGQFEHPEVSSVLLPNRDIFCILLPVSYTGSRQETSIVPWMLS